MRLALPLPIAQLVGLLGRALLRPCLGCQRSRLVPLCPSCKALSLCGQSLHRLPNPTTIPASAIKPLAAVYYYGVYSQMTTASNRDSTHTTPLASALLRFKYRRHSQTGRRLASLLAVQAYSARLTCDVVIAVPLAPERLARRGFNQAAWLARAVATNIGRPLATDILWRCRDTPAQALLPRRQRLKNLDLAFQVRSGSNPPGRVLLVDDVFTTGATLKAAARALYKNGASRVDALVLLRALARPKL
jgi:ComF family protein